MHWDSRQRAQRDDIDGQTFVDLEIQESVNIRIDDGLGVLDIDGRDDVGACGVVPRDDLKARCGIDTTNQTLEFLHGAL